ncbi:MAG: hypothetical protein PGN13_05320 [Patulibacter minatonensis]
MQVQWSCRACEESDPGQRSGRAWFCTDCQSARGLYRTTRSNLASGFNRTLKGSPELAIDIDAFCVWRKAQEQRCHYCRISEADLTRVRMKSQVQKDVRIMGVDRVDDTLGYVAENLVPCCFVCNQVKGDRFSEAEMLLVGRGIALAWEQRLAAP